MSSEMNERVALKLGFTKDEESGMWQYDCDQFRLSTRHLPDFCGEISAAWWVLDKGLVDGVMRLPDGRWIAGCLGEYLTNSIPADTPAMAICVELLRPKHPSSNAGNN